MSYPHRVGLMIAVPHTGRGLPPAWAWSFANLHPPMNFNLRYLSNLHIGGLVLPGDVDNLRNWFIEQAIAENCEMLFFLDEDVVVPPHTLRQLIYQMEHHPDAAAIGGIYCSKTEPTFPMVFRGNGGGPYWDWKVGECFEVSGMGLGCTLLRMSALKELGDDWCKTVDNADDLLEGKNKVEAWTEDLWLFEKITARGWKLYADAAVLATHWDLNAMQPYRLPEGSKPLMLPVFEDADVRRLVLGTYWPVPADLAGRRLTAATDEDAGVDYRCDAGRLPFEADSFDEILAQVQMEAYAYEAVVDLLDEWRRVLAPGGRLFLTLLNARRLASEFQPSHIVEQLQGALSLYTPEDLAVMLADMDMKFEVTEVGYTWRIEIAKPSAVIG